MKTFYKLVFVMSFIAIVFTQSANTQVTVSGSNGKDGTYTSLTNASGAFLAINAVSQTGKTILITITSDVTTETGINALTGAAGMWTTLTINPTGARTISGEVAGAPLINLNGADNVTINGLNDGTNSLTIFNLSILSNSGTSTIKFIGDATNNTITNCTILGSATTPLTQNGGNIWISTGTTTGNDNITISNCKIGPVGSNLPSKGIYGNGSTTSATIANSNVTVNNCEIYDFFLTGGCAGVYALTGNTDWTITNNKICQTEIRTFTAAGTMSGIYFANATYGDNVQITGNTIGYAANNGTGTLTLTGSSVAGAFQGIFLNAMPTAAIACNINNNIISDISLTSSNGTFCGINNQTTATSNTININSNIVRNIATFNIGTTHYGICAGSATTLSVNLNTIDNITRTGSGPTYGILVGSPTTATFNTNTISNLALNNTTSTSTVYGIYCLNTGINITANGNNIFNLSTTSTKTVKIAGIAEDAGGSGNKVFQNNNINNLSAGGGATITGIRVSVESTPNAMDISGNTIYTFSGGLKEYGIDQASTSATSNIYKNKIYDLSTTNATTTVTVYGIYLSGAGTTNNVYNNFISDLRTTAANAVLPLAGIYVNAGTTNNIYYNTVYLNATSSGAVFGSAGIYANTTPTVDMRNNIIVNTSIPNGATGYTAAYKRSSNTLTTYASTSNNNLFYAGTPGTYNVIFYYVSGSDQTLAAYKTRVSPRDVASITELPPFVNVSTTPYDLHINTETSTQCKSGGIRITSPFAITTDYDADIRWGETGYVGTGTAPDIGADEFEIPPYTWTGTTSTDWTEPTNWSPSRNYKSNNDVLQFNNGQNITLTNVPTEIVGQLAISNYTNITFPSSGSATLIVSGTLTMTSGSITTGSTNTLTLGTSISQLGSLNYTSGTIIGNFARWFNAATVSGVLFPVGTSSNYRPISLSYTVAPITAGTLTVTHIVGDPGNNSTNSVDDGGYLIDSYSTAGYWTITSTVSGGTYGIDMTADGFLNSITPNNYAKLHLLKRVNSSSNWGVDGTYVTSDGSQQTPVLHRTGLSNFSDFAVGSNINDNNFNGTLPVELSSFLSNVGNGKVTLNWVTSNEINNMGFEIHRAVKDENNWAKIGFVYGNGTKSTPTSYKFEDKKLNVGKYQYQLKQIDNNGNYKYYTLNGFVEVTSPKKYNITQNYPNPFNPVTKIDYALPFDSRVRIIVYDMLGREIKSLVSGEMKQAGYYTIEFNATNIASGIYFYRMIANGQEKDNIFTKKMVVLK